MQSRPDWYKRMSERVFQEEFGLNFNGPGFYLTATDTILVVPLPPRAAPTLETVWDMDQPAGTLFDVMCYNVPFRETIFAAIATAPVRRETR